MRKQCLGRIDAASRDRSQSRRNRWECQWEKVVHRSERVTWVYTNMDEMERRGMLNSITRRTILLYRHCLLDRAVEFSSWSRTLFLSPSLKCRPHIPLRQPTIFLFTIVILRWFCICIRIMLTFSVVFIAILAPFPHVSHSWLSHSFRLYIFYQIIAGRPAMDQWYIRDTIRASRSRQIEREEWLKLNRNKKKIEMKV